MYKALYREYRPETFEEVLGQEHIVKILKNQIKTDAVSHAYLFCGTRGTGKTTTARLLAKGMNCLAEDPANRPCGECAHCKAIKNGTFLDVIEIDAASNNGVDNIRELRESVKYPPAIGRKKVYVIDEVHMLSGGAFNALLKTLEEPPEHVMFILATTEPQKLPATILSRCMRLDFRRVSEKDLLRGLDDICKARGLEVSESALRLVVANADGSVRDGLSILDQCIASGQKKLGREDILEFLGTSGEEVFIDMTDFVRTGNTAEALLLVEKVLSDGKDIRQFMRDWLGHYRSLLLSRFLKSPEDILNMSTENVERIKNQSDRMDLVDINNAIVELSRTMSDAKWSNQPRILLELCIVKLATGLVSARLVPKQPEQQKNQTVAPVKSGEVVKNGNFGNSGNAEAVGNSGNAGASGNSGNSGEIGRIGNAEASGNLQNTEQAKNTEIGDNSLDTRNKGNIDFSENPEISENPAMTIETDKNGNAQSESIAQVDDMKELTTPQFDLDELWMKVFEAGEDDKGSFNLIRTSTRLIELSSGEFVVEANNDTKARYVNGNKEQLEYLMEHFTGVPRRLKCVIANSDEQGYTQEDTEELSLNQLFGSNIEFK